MQKEPISKKYQLFHFNSIFFFFLDKITDWLKEQQDCRDCGRQPSTNSKQVQSEASI